MDFIAELIFEFILLILGNVVEESKAKTWIKTVIVSIFAQTVTVGFSIISVFELQAGNNGGYVVAVIAVLWFTATVIGTIKGHRREWKQSAR